MRFVLLKNTALLGFMDDIAVEIITKFLKQFFLCCIRYQTVGGWDGINWPGTQKDKKLAWYKKLAETKRDRSNLVGIRWKWKILYIQMAIISIHLVLASTTLKKLYIKFQELY